MAEANMVLKNVKLKQDAFLKLNLPVNIELGEIRHLEVRYFLNIDYRLGSPG